MNGSATVSQQPSQSKDAAPKALPMAKQQDLPKLSPADSAAATSAGSTAAPSSASTAPQASNRSTSGLQSAVPNTPAASGGSVAADNGSQNKSQFLYLNDIRSTVKGILP